MTNDALRLLSALGEGEANAMTRGALCALLGLPDRTVRKLIEEARREETEDGPFIVNACEGKGYYLSNDPAEAEVLRKIEMARIASIVGRTYGLSEMIRKAGRS